MFIEASIFALIQLLQLYWNSVALAVFVYRAHPKLHIFSEQRTNKKEIPYASQKGNTE